MLVYILTFQNTNNIPFVNGLTRLFLLKLEYLVKYIKHTNNLISYLMIFKNNSVFHCSSKVVYLILNYLSFFLQARNIFENTVYKAENYDFSEIALRGSYALYYTPVQVSFTIHCIFFTVHQVKMEQIYYLECLLCVFLKI